MPFCLCRFDEGASIASADEEGTVEEGECPFVSILDGNGRGDCMYTSAGEELMIKVCTTMCDRSWVGAGRPRARVEWRRGLYTAIGWLERY